VPAAEVGVASSALNAARQMGGVLGVAVLGGLLSAHDYVTGLPVAMVLCAAAFAGVALVGARLEGAAARVSRCRVTAERSPAAPEQGRA
jgi:DHA2 family methylenomycin A resistance protein-like MFS transporter